LKPHYDGFSMTGNVCWTKLFFIRRGKKKIKRKKKAKTTGFEPKRKKLKKKARSNFTDEEKKRKKNEINWT